MNRRDENAVLVHVCPGETWEPIGYIPGVKVLKVTQAINNNEITSMSLVSVKYQDVFSISSFKYFAIVTISKKGRWAKTGTTTNIMKLSKVASALLGNNSLYSVVLLVGFN